MDIFNFTRLPALSSFAGSIDDVIGWVTVLVGFWFVLTEAVFFYFILKYRKKNSPKAAYITGEEPELHRWISRPHAAVLVFDVFIVIIGVKVWIDVKQSLPPEPVPHVRVVAQQWAWSFVHPGLDNQLDTADDIKTVDDLHIQAGQQYIWELESRDVLHSFSIPTMRMKQDAVPGRVIKGWFDANAAGVYEIQCAEICGIGHGLMPAKLHVEDAAAHVAWMQAHAPVARIAAN
ncbi:MAG TPA: cytochrome C oxidase subunit II [Myxococcota bacterium]